MAEKSTIICVQIITRYCEKEGDLSDPPNVKEGSFTSTVHSAMGNHALDIWNANDNNFNY